jgi:anti-anti-sigma factor
VVAVSGELDLASAEVLRPELLGVLAGLGAASATLDLRGTTYLASAGVGLLLEADALARRAGLALRLLVHPGSSVARLLHVSRLDGVLAVDAVEQPGG